MDGHLIRARREFLGFTQSEVAESAGMSQATFCNLENGISKDTASRFAIRIAKKLETSVEALSESASVLEPTK